ncbi:MAG: hypothetical protein JSS87_11010 [Acidobacteria bacterium]|nr:hypothetical protein [Acidobacteriota bacterium]
MSEEQQFASVMALLYGGPQRPIEENVDIQFRIRNQNGFDRTISHKGTRCDLQIPFNNGMGDEYFIIASVDGFRPAAATVKADPAIHQTISFLLIPDKAEFQFPQWPELKQSKPAIAALIASGLDERDAENLYEKLKNEKPSAMASFFNLCTAMEDIGIGAGFTPMDYIKEVCWDETFAQDRFFGYADTAIIPMIKAASKEGEFAEEEDCAAFHPNATCSYKQTTYDYANVQLTFHENDRKTIQGIECVMIEPDIDLYKNLGEHGIEEVVPNLSTARKTDPLQVLQLRWMDAVRSDKSIFDPGYVIS